MIDDLCIKYYWFTVTEYLSFLPRYASAVYAAIVCPSIRLSQAMYY